MNLNAYDSIIDKIDKTKTWVDVRKRILLSREINYRSYYVLTKRYNPDEKCTDYFVILLDNQPSDRISFRTAKDDYGRIKIRLYELYEESDLKYLDKDKNINVIHVDSDEDGDVYQLEV